MHTTINEKDRLDMASHGHAADHALNWRGRRALLQVPSDRWRVIVTQTLAEELPRYQSTCRVAPSCL